MNKIFRLGVTNITTALLLVFLAGGNAQAALVSYQITGDVLAGDEFGDANAFGLAAGDIVVVEGVFDDSVLTSGSGLIDFSSGSGNTMTINIGTEILTAGNDTGFGTGGGPSITLNSFLLDDFDFQAFAGVNGAVADFNSNFTFFDDFNLMFGEWQIDIQLTPVPVPAAVWLFGSGLLGLAGIARRKS